MPDPGATLARLREFSGDHFLRRRRPEVFVLAMPDKEARARESLRELGLLGRARGVRAFDVRARGTQRLVDLGLVDAGYRDRCEERGEAYALGCQLSHMVALAEFLESGREWALVLEDDVAYPRGARAARRELAALQRLVRREVREPAVVFAGYCYAEALGPEYRPGLHHLVAPKCTHSYMVNRAAAERVLALLAPQERPIDETLPFGDFLVLGPSAPVLVQDWSEVGDKPGAGSVLKPDAAGRLAFPAFKDPEMNDPGTAPTLAERMEGEPQPLRGAIMAALALLTAALALASALAGRSRNALLLVLVALFLACAAYLACVGFFIT